MLDECISIHLFTFLAPFTLFTFGGHTHQGGRPPFGYAIAVERQRQLQTTGQARKDRAEWHLKPVHLQAVGAAGQVFSDFNHRHESRGTMIVSTVIVFTLIMPGMFMF